MDHRNRAAEVEQSFEKMEQAWEETQGEVDQVMGSQIGQRKEQRRLGSGAEQGTKNGEADRKRTRTEREQQMTSLRQSG